MIIFSGALIFIMIDDYTPGELLDFDGPGIFQAISNFWKNQGTQIVILLICIVLILLILRNHIIKTTRIYQQIIASQHELLESYKREIGYEQQFKDQALKNLDEMTAHYEALKNEIERLKQSYERITNTEKTA
ncbi:MAG: hypothetical protein JXB49_26100 [Bacteroidales bacterium]|nr:hypothetical protein [Bacteroidales bacterium]